MIDKQRRQPETLLDHRYESVVQGRHNRGNRNALDLFQIDPGEFKPTPQFRSILLGSSGVIGKESPLTNEVNSSKHSELKIRIARVNCQKHERLSRSHSAFRTKPVL